MSTAALIILVVTAMFAVVFGVFYIANNMPK